MSYLNERPSDLNGTTDASETPKGPHPSFIQVAKPYIFEQEIQSRLAQIKIGESREATLRLQGVTWIDNVRKALQLPIRTYNTAVVYYHKFRLVHHENEYDYRDAAAASLFGACKIEDTLKKSRDILCAAYNLKLAPTEHLSPDDSIFDSHSKTIVGLERLMLEASGFDFRSRHPQKLLIKFARAGGFEKHTVGILAYRMLIDLYRTFAPLKQSSATMAHACLELAVRLSGETMPSMAAGAVFDYTKWSITRQEVMETLLDLLDLYTHNKNNTVVGNEHSLESFINIHIKLNQEAKAADLPRFTKWQAKESRNGNGDFGKHANNWSKRDRSHTDTSPRSPSDQPIPVGERGKDGTVRFMLDPARMKHEKEKVDEFFRKDEVEETTSDSMRDDYRGDFRTNRVGDAAEQKRRRLDTGRHYEENRPRADHEDERRGRPRHNNYSESSERYRTRGDIESPLTTYEPAHDRRGWDREKYERELAAPPKRGKFTLASWRDR